MVARIVSGKNIEGMLRYNESKVAAGKARMLEAFSFPKDGAALRFKDKLVRFQNLTALNSRVRTNAVHISLNFDPSEQPGDGLLREIAAAYMEGIGFSDQPYLVYRHKDAAHPHIHIVTTNIAADGSRISLHNIGRLKSEPVRVALEQRFGLVAAVGKQLGKSADKTPQRLVYGQQETKRGIADVVGYVLRHYRCTSLGSLNAVLSIYGVAADRGKKDTAMYARGGLQYWIISTNDNKQGVPIKASALPGRPTLSKLQDNFRRNEQAVVAARARIRSAVDRAVLVAKTKGCSLATALEKEQIVLSVNRNHEGRIYGWNLVDLRYKIALKGSELGKAYGVQGIFQQLETTAGSQRLATVQHNTRTDDWHQVPGFLTALIDPIAQSDRAVDAFRKKRKKKKSKKI